MHTVLSKHAHAKCHRHGHLKPLSAICDCVLHPAYYSFSPHLLPIQPPPAPTSTNLMRIIIIRSPNQAIASTASRPPGRKKEGAPLH
jgi:hypothetical protein